MGNFDLLVLGSSGGPLEGHNSSFILKPHSISFNDIITKKLDQYMISIDSGAGLGKLAELISDEKQGNTNRITERSITLYSESIGLEEANPSNLPTTSSLGLQSILDSSIEIAFTFCDLVKSHLVSHSHLDHIASLAINSPGFGIASGKTVYGLKETINALQNFIFNDSVWPDLSSPLNGNFLNFKILNNNEKVEISPVYNITPFQLNHGCTHTKLPNITYHSTAHLIEHGSKQILIFGDVESDVDAAATTPTSSNLNLHIWKSISSLIVNDTLKTIVIECSTPILPYNVPSYGHLNPTALISELRTLAEVITDKLKEQDTPLDDERFKNPLKGLDILITHVKDRRGPVDPKKLIIEQLNELNEKFQLGCHFTILLAGQIYTVN